jgi:DNA-binding transcriptional ArsR family regulator
MRSSMDEVIHFEVREMIWLELDYAVGAYAFGRNRRYLTDEQIKIYQQIPRDWYQLALLVLPKTDDSLMIFEMLALLCPKGTLSKSYAEIRDYLQNLGDLDWRNWFEVSGTSCISDYLMVLAKEHQAGVEESYLNMPRLLDTMEKTAAQIEKIFTSMTMEEAFWNCMDVFVERYYLRWRKHHVAQMSERKAFFEALREKEGGCTMGDLMAVLPKTNALYYRSAFRKHILEGRLPLVIWIEPIGLFDSWAILRKHLVISVAEPDALFQLAKDEIVELSEKGKALGDPTRLGILRVIRHFDMDITELADYFGLARPTVSVHMKKLREAGLVDLIEDGRSTRHVLNAKNVRALLAEIERFLELE